jgi:hypothetical protein
MPKKLPPKPMFSIKGDFMDTLDAFIHEAGMLCSAVEQAVKLGAVDERAAKILRDRVAAFRAIQLGSDNEDAP